MQSEIWYNVGKHYTCASGFCVHRRKQWAVPGLPCNPGEYEKRINSFKKGEKL